MDSILRHREVGRVKDLSAPRYKRLFAISKKFALLFMQYYVCLKMQ